MSARSCLVPLMLLGLCACSTAPRLDPEVAAGRWPQWRGVDRSGVSAETGLLKEWPVGGPPLLWTADGAGSGFSSVSVAEGRLYTMGKRDDGEYVISYDLADGSEVWATRTGGRYDNDRGGGPRATPTIDGDRIYSLGAEGDLSCLAAADGAQQWSINILEEFGTENLRWGISESVLVDERHVYVLTGSSEGSLVALDKTSGDVVWQSAEMTDEPGYASPLLIDVDGVRQIIHFTAEAGVGIRASDGALLWRNESAANDTANCATPLYRDGHVFFSSGYDTGAALVRLTSDGTSTSAEEIYFTRKMRNHHGGVVLVGDFVYGFDNTRLGCLHFESGEGMWREKSVGKGSITAADGMLYILSERGRVALVEATPKRYSEKGRFQIDADERPSWAHPVVVGGRLYIRNRGEIHCYDVRA